MGQTDGQTDVRPMHYV